MILALAEKKLVLSSWRFIRKNMRMIRKEIKDSTCNPGRKQGKNLVHRRQKKSQGHQPFIGL